MQQEKKTCNSKGTSMRLSADFLAEILQAWREWNDTVKVLKEKKLPTENALPGKDVLQK